MHTVSPRDLQTHVQAFAALSRLSVSLSALGPLPSGVRDQARGKPWRPGRPAELHGGDTCVPALRPTICLAHVSAFVASGWLTWPHSTVWTLSLSARRLPGPVRRQGQACELSWWRRPAGESWRRAVLQRRAVSQRHAVNWDPEQGHQRGAGTVAGVPEHWLCPRPSALRLRQGGLTGRPPKVVIATENTFLHGITGMITWGLVLHCLSLGESSRAVIEEKWGCLQ